MRREATLIAALLAATPALAQPAGTFAIAGEVFAPADILDARALPVVGGGAIIMLTFTKAAAKRIEKITTARVGQPIRIMLDGEILMEPIVHEPLSSNVVHISSNFGIDEAVAKAKRISGKDPLPEDLAE